MKISKYVLLALCFITIFMLFACASKQKVRVIELENKGTALGVSAPSWVRNYTSHGMSRVQSQSEFRDKYCIIGEEIGTNKQFVLGRADHFSAQQRIGAMLRTTIVSEYQARVQGIAQSTGVGSAQSAVESTYQQQIDSIISSVVNVSYSGAFREGDWWSLRRRYDPDDKTKFNDEYTAYVLYTIPKVELNRQVANALETSVTRDSALYDVTIEIAMQLMRNGIASWGE